MPEASNQRSDFCSWKLAAFSGFRALGHLDLKFGGSDEIFGGDAKPGGGDLLDAIRCFGLGAVNFGILAAFARVAARTQAIHRDGEGAMGFRGESAERHRLGTETIENTYFSFSLCVM